MAKAITTPAPAQPVNEPVDTQPTALPEKQEDGLVEVTVTKFGDGQVSTGVHVTGTGDIYAKRGDKMRVSPTIARSLEARGLAETD